MAICYKDMTFCIRDCKNKKCERNKKHTENATYNGLPICYCDFYDCKEYKS